MDSTLTALLELSDFYGRICGVISSRDEEFIDDHGALMRIRELIALRETKELEQQP